MRRAPQAPAPLQPPPALTSPLHHLVELALDVQLGVLRFHTLKLDGNFFTRGDVGTCQGQGTGVTLSWAGSTSPGPTKCLPPSSSAPLGGGCAEGPALYPREAEGLWDTEQAADPAWVGGESQSCSSCQGTEVRAMDHSENRRLGQQEGWMRGGSGHSRKTLTDQ